MKRCTIIIFSVILPLCYSSIQILRSDTKPETQEIALQQLLRRILLKSDSERFDITIDSTLASGTVNVTLSGQRILMRADSGVSGAYGAARVLRQWAGAHFAWVGLSGGRLPATLPQTHFQARAVGGYRYMSNVCTFSYSYVWWKWAEWEAFIDWMALSGINLPLAHVGAEGVWRRLWLRMGLTQAELDDFFTGPAFLAWHRMGNLKRWGGPLSADWHNGQIRLQKQIVRRMSDLGMIPVLPAFAGFVPEGLRRLFPKAAISRSNDWGPFEGEGRFTGLSFLDPLDPLFPSIGNDYIRELNASIGYVAHAYSADSFNEMPPRSFAPAFLANVSRAIFDGMQGADPQAHWVMQAWLFLSNKDKWAANNSAAVRALTGALPRGRLLLLDLTSEAVPQYRRFPSFFGAAWLWNTLQDYGGNLELGGRVGAINQGINEGLNMHNSSMVGTGLTMEGIYNNYPIYQFTLDRSWHIVPVDSIDWIANYSKERYGSNASEQVVTAWKLLWTSVYNDTSPIGSNRVTKLGIHHPHTNFLFQRPKLGKTYYAWYNSSNLCKAWTILVDESRKYGNNVYYRHDMVDISRQAMELVGLTLYTRVVQSFAHQHLDEFDLASNSFLNWWTDLDALLSSNEHFLLGSWLKASRDKGSSPSESDQFEANARNQITLWGPQGQIVDYARKQWGGLTAAYYRPRWALFVKFLRKSLVSGRGFSQKEFVASVLASIEKPFCSSKNTFPSEPTGSDILIANMMHTKYGRLCPLQFGP